MRRQLPRFSAENFGKNIELVRGGGFEELVGGRGRGETVAQAVSGFMFLFVLPFLEMSRKTSSKSSRRGDHLDIFVSATARACPQRPHTDLITNIQVLAWILKQGEDFFPIPGTKSLKYLEENVVCLGVELTDAEEESVRQKIEKMGGAHGKVSPHEPFADTPPL